MTGISLPKASFLALVLESLLYGAFTVLFLAAGWVITVKRSVVNYRLLATIITIWLLSTTHLILDICRAMNAFVDGPPGGALTYYLNLANPLQAAKTAVYVLLTLVGDAFVIYRCWIIWSRAWWIIPLPTLLWSGTGIGGFGATVAFSKAAPGAEVFLPAIVPWVTSFISLTLSTNVVCTCLISFKLWTIRRDLRGAAYQSSLGQSTVIIIIESAALYSASVIALMASYQLGSNAQYTILDLTSPLIGITFTIIILRVSMGLSAKQLSTLNVPGTSSGQPGSRYGTGGQLRFRNASAPVTVNVSQLVEVDHDNELDSSERSDIHKDPSLIKERMV